MLQRTFPRSAFTLSDLGVVFVLGTTTLGLLLPAVQKLRSAEARVKCADHLRVIGSAAAKFASANDDRLPRDSITTPHTSWNTYLLPFMGEEKLVKRYVPGQDWWEAGEDGNRIVAATRVTSFVCPATPDPKRWVLTQDPDDLQKSFQAAPTDYVGVAGAYYQTNDPANLHVGAMHQRNLTRPLRTSDILDGTSNTLLVVEMADKPNAWRTGKRQEDRTNKPQALALAGQWAAPNWNHLRSHSSDGSTAFGPCAVNCNNGAAIFGFHPGGANTLFVDGSVRFLKAGLSQEMLIALVSIAGGELIAADDF